MARRGRKRRLETESLYWQLIVSGVGTVQACQEAGIGRKTGYRWRAENGGLPPGRVAEDVRAESRTVVTGNVADFAAERDIPLVFVLKRKLPAGSGQAAALGKILDRWAQEHPAPYLGHHWPAT